MVTGTIFHIIEGWDERNTEWYTQDNFRYEINFDNENPDTRVYGVASSMNTMWNTRLSDSYMGYVVIQSNSAFSYSGYTQTGGATSGTTTQLTLGAINANGGILTADRIGILSGINERMTTTITEIPIFDQNDTDAIQNYIETGDDSGALNYDYLHSSPVDYYLTNNGDRIELKWVLQNGKQPLLDETEIIFDPRLITTETITKRFTNESYLTTWEQLISETRGLLPDVLVNTVDVTINALYSDSVVATLKGTMVKGGLGKETECYATISESNGYHLYCTTDNSFDDIGTDSQDESDATGNDNDGSNFGGFSNLTCTYKLSKQALSDLGSFIWNNDAFSNIKLFNNSPIENIISCMYMPVDIGGESANIILGNVETNVSGVKTGQNMKKVNIASFTMPKVNTGFLGYEPYTSVSLYLPLVGMIDLIPNDVCGYTITIDYVFDIVCGSFGVMVYTSKGGGKTMLYSSQGNCSVTIPLTASNQAQVQTAILQSGVSLVSDAITSNGLGAISDATNILTAQNHSTTYGSPSSMVGALSPQYCYYIIRTPIISLPNNFAHTKGYMCMATYTMNELKGFTKLSNDVDLSGFNATEREKEELINILTSGFYL